VSAVPNTMTAKEFPDSLPWVTKKRTLLSAHEAFDKKVREHNALLKTLATRVKSITALLEDDRHLEWSYVAEMQVLNSVLKETLASLENGSPL
jgi:hypothetical protein